MNRTECKKDIKLHQQNAEKFSKYQDRIKAKIEKLQQQIDKAQNDERYENGLVEYLELAMQKETSAKRRGTLSDLARWRGSSTPSSSSW